jgi:hypothetical protein
LHGGPLDEKIVEPPDEKQVGPPDEKIVEPLDEKIVGPPESACQDVAAATGPRHQANTVGAKADAAQPLLQGYDELGPSPAVPLPQASPDEILDAVAGSFSEPPHDPRVTLTAQNIAPIGNQSLQFQKVKDSKPTSK